MVLFSCAQIASVCHWVEGFCRGDFFPFYVEIDFFPFDMPNMLTELCFCFIFYIFERFFMVCQPIFEEGGELTLCMFHLHPHHVKLLPGKLG